MIVEKIYTPGVIGWPFSNILTVLIINFLCIWDGAEFYEFELGR